jgi:hypothetical protein
MATAYKAVTSDHLSCWQDVRGVVGASVRPAALDYSIESTVTAATPEGIYLYVDDPDVDPPSGDWGTGGALHRAIATAKCLATHTTFIFGDPDRPWLPTDVVYDDPGRVVEVDYEPADVIAIQQADPFTLIVQVPSCVVTGEVSFGGV